MDRGSRVSGAEDAADGGNAFIWHSFGTVDGDLALDAICATGVGGAATE
ncbi:hypothetical protein ABIB56_002584 [Glaciihabitans sp. UYNi722]